MAENQADDDDDEGFGDFKFVSSVNQDHRVEDDWGDFMDNFSHKQDFFGNQSLSFTQTLNPTIPSQTSQSFDLFGDFSDHSTKTTDSKLNDVESEKKNSASPVAKKLWEKPQGAIPLSIFGEEEEEEESDSNNPSFNETPDLFPTKNLSSPVKNEIKIGQGFHLNDLIVNLYSKTDQIKIENGSNSNLVDGDENFDDDDDDGWQFKDASSQDMVGDRNSAVEVEVTSNLSGVQVETETGRTTDQLFEVNGIGSENSEGTLHKSGLNNGALDSGDIFATSDWLSHKSAGLDNGFGFGFVTSIDTQNGSISGSFSQDKQNSTENGLNSKSGDGNIDADDNFWDFKDAFSESEDVNFSSGNKEEQKGAVFSDADVKVLAFDRELQVNGKRSENSEGTLHKSGLNNGSLDSGDIFATSDWLSHKSAGSGNGLCFVTSIAAQNSSVSGSFSQARQNSTENGSNSKSGDGNIDADDNFWDFKDAFSESEDVNCSSGNKVNGKGIGDHQESLSLSFFSNGKLDADDSLYGEDVSSHKPANDVRNSTYGQGFDPNVSLTDLISTLYSQAEGIPAVTSTKKQTGDELSSAKVGVNADLVNGEDDFDENSWEFRDAFSEPKVEDEFSSIQVGSFNSNGKPSEAQVGLHSDLVNGEDDFDGNSWEFRDGFSETKVEDEFSSIQLSVGSFNSNRKPTEAQVGLNSDLVNGEVDFDENSWEFKDALSETKVEGDFSSIQVGVSSFNSNGKPTEAQVILNSDIVKGEDDFDENSWEFRDAISETKAEGQSYAFNLSDTDQRFLSKSNFKNFVDFYSRLKEKSCIVSLHHLDYLKKAQKVAAISGEDVKAMALHEEIQAAYKKLHKEDMMSEEVYSEELSTRNFISDEFMNDPKFQVLESEYHLSKRISLAENDLTSAIELFEHAILILKILSVGSVEEQSKYITTWSKMISACARELKHGAFIWKQSLLKTIHKKILSEPQGQKYFLALAEIYRVVGVIRASIILYKPWILSNLVDPSVIFALLEECMTVWSDSGLEEAVRSIPDPVSVGYDGTIKALLASIKSIHDIDAVALQNRVFSLKEPICQLSGLSHAVVPDMKVVVWDGGHYFLTLANLWANRISCDPPKTSHLHISDDDFQS